MIAGNYKSSRLLAETIQNENHQPYILVPDTRSADGRIFYCPPPGNPCIEVPAAHFNEFIRNANPKRIIILGDTTYVPESYEKQLDGLIPVVRITGKDWNRIAEELTFMLNLSHVDKNYRKMRDTMLNDGNIYRPVSRPAEIPAANANGANVLPPAAPAEM
jgi:hypothetical protein